jgi:acylphosphatase
LYKNYHHFHNNQEYFMKSIISRVTIAIAIGIIAQAETLQATAVPRRCVTDLAVQPVDFRIVKRTSKYAGDVKITGIVCNIGAKPYKVVVNGNKPVVKIYREQVGTSPREVATALIPELGVGKEMKVSYIRDWNASSPSEGEFPPSYRVAIEYGSRLNAALDCNSTNNQVTRNGEDINALFDVKVRQPVDTKVPVDVRENRN